MKIRDILKNIKNSRLANQVLAVRYDPESIKFIKNQEVQLAAVSQNPWVIRYIKNPTEEVQLAAVKKDGSVIELLMTHGKPSEAVQAAAVRQAPWTLEHIPNPSEYVQLQARTAVIKRNGYAVLSIKNPTLDEVLMAFFNGSAEKNVVIPTLLEMVKKADSAERYHRVLRIINLLTQVGIKWPEFDVIEKSLKAELAKHQ